MCGAADDPTWGTYGQRLRIRGHRDRVEALHARGIKALTWIEAFGTAHAYIAQFKRREDGGWVGFPEDPSIPRPFATHYGWQAYDGTGEIRWIGIQNYYDCDDIDQAKRAVENYLAAIGYELTDEDDKRLTFKFTDRQSMLAAAALGTMDDNLVVVTTKGKPKYMRFGLAPRAGRSLGARA